MRTLVSDLNLSNEQLHYAKQSVDFTKKSYEHSLQRQKLGTANQLELFHAEKEYLNAKLIYIDAISYKQEITHKKLAAFSEKVVQ